MSRRPPRENTARSARNRLMVDHSPPRDIRKRKFEKLNRSSGGQHRDLHGSQAFGRAMVQPLPQAIPGDRSVGSTPCTGQDREGIPATLPVKNKVFILSSSLSRVWHNVILDSKRLPSRVSPM